MGAWKKILLHCIASLGEVLWLKDSRHTPRAIGKDDLMSISSQLYVLVFGHSSISSILSTWTPAESPGGTLSGISPTRTGPGILGVFFSFRTARIRRPWTSGQVEMSPRPVSTGGRRDQGCRERGRFGVQQPFVLVDWMMFQAFSGLIR